MCQNCVDEKITFRTFRGRPHPNAVKEPATEMLAEVAVMQGWTRDEDTRHIHLTAPNGNSVSLARYLLPQVTPAEFIAAALRLMERHGYQP